MKSKEDVMWQLPTLQEVGVLLMHTCIIKNKKMHWYYADTEMDVEKHVKSVAS